MVSSTCGARCYTGHNHNGNANRTWKLRQTGLLAQNSRHSLTLSSALAGLQFEARYEAAHAVTAMGTMLPTRAGRAHDVTGHSRTPLHHRDWHRD